MSLVNRMLLDLEGRGSAVHTEPALAGLSSVDYCLSEQARSRRSARRVAAIGTAGIMALFAAWQFPFESAPQSRPAAIQPGGAAIPVSPGPTSQPFNDGEPDTAVNPTLKSLKLDEQLLSLGRFQAPQNAMASVSETSRAPAIPAAAVVSGVDVESRDSGAAVQIMLTAPAHYIVYPLTNPHRLVVELSGTGQVEAFSREFDSGLVRRARTRWENGRTVLVLDLSGPAGDVTSRVENLENGARLSLLMDQPVTARAGIETGSPEPVAAVDAGAVVTPGQLTLGRAGIDGLYDEAAALCSDGNVAAGIAKLTELIERDPGHVRGRQLLATVLVQNGDSREAANILDAGLRQRPGVWQWAQLRAQLAVDGGAPVLAHEILARSPPPLADQPDYHAFLAAVQQRIGRHADAVKNYRAVLGQRPERGVWWIGLGISLHALSRDTEAGIAFRRALSDASLTPQLRDFAQSRLASVAITPAS